VANAIWWVAMFVGLALVIVLPRVAWYALMTRRNRLSHAKAVQRALSQGQQPPEPPPAPDLWAVQRRVARISGALGLAGALVALLLFLISSHR
jgi:hypothetical protein